MNSFVHSAVDWVEWIFNSWCVQCGWKQRKWPFHRMNFIAGAIYPVLSVVGDFWCKPNDLWRSRMSRYCAQCTHTISMEKNNRSNFGWLTSSPMCAIVQIWHSHKQTNYTNDHIRRSPEMNGQRAEAERACEEERKFLLHLHKKHSVVSKPTNYFCCVGPNTKTTKYVRLSLCQHVASVKMVHADCCMQIELTEIFRLFSAFLFSVFTVYCRRRCNKTSYQEQNLTEHGNCTKAKRVVEKGGKITEKVLKKTPK